MLEDLTYTDWLLIAVLWLQVMNLLVQAWSKLSRLRHHDQTVHTYSEEKKKEKKKDAYEKMLEEKNGGEKKE